MTLQIERITTLQDNYSYLLICQETRDAAVVDAPEAGPVIRRVEETGAKVSKILSTHHHGDHTMANPELAKLYDAPVYGHHSDAGRIPGFTNGLEEGDTISVGNETARILFIPSHTMGHIAYVFDDAKALFSGDMLFAGGCGRIFEGDAQLMYDALCNKLAALPDDMRVYCGHEYTESNLRFATHIEPDNQAAADRLASVQKLRAGHAADWHDATPNEMTIPSTIGEEKATNPFMRSPDAEELGRRRSIKDSFQ